MMCKRVDGKEEQEEDERLRHASAVMAVGTYFYNESSTNIAYAASWYSCTRTSDFFTLILQARAKTHKKIKPITSNIKRQRTRRKARLNTLCLFSICQLARSDLPTSS